MPVVQATAVALLALIASHCSSSSASSAGNATKPPPPMRVDFDPPALLLPDRAMASTGNVRVLSITAGASDVLVADPIAREVTWLAGCPAHCVAQVFRDHFLAPVRTAVSDLDGDGDRDIVVTDIGSLVDDPAHIGAIALLENDGHGSFLPARVLVDKLHRPACAEPADLDGDGDVDLIGCMFGVGPPTGELAWFEQRRDHSFVHHAIDPISGTIVGLPWDADGDGDLDVVALVSRTAEEIDLYVNDGKGTFTKQHIFQSGNDCYGFSSLELFDLDGDGRLDLLSTNGDSAHPECSREEIAKLHGVAWFRNLGELRFERHAITQLYGAYVARVADFNGDGAPDIVAASFRDFQNALTDPTPNLVYLENDGHQAFTRREIPGGPPAVITLDVGDLDGDGTPDLVTGSLEADAPAPGAHRLAFFRGRRTPR